MIFFSVFIVCRVFYFYFFGVFLLYMYMNILNRFSVLALIIRRNRLRENCDVLILGVFMNLMLYVNGSLILIVFFMMF